MSASLVGSEMCIRDSSCSSVIDRPMTVNTVNNDVKDAQKEAIDRILEKHLPVSYTHLTLPTILRV
ncbi:hypothetical protein JMUB7550_27570 [Staphylococcus aureus]